MKQLWISKIKISRIPKIQDPFLTAITVAVAVSLFALYAHADVPTSGTAANPNPSANSSTLNAKLPAPAPEKPTQLNLSVQFKGVSIFDDNQQAQIAGASIRGKLDQRFDENFSGLLDAGIGLEAGSFQSHYSDEYKPAKRLSLYEASVAWKPVPQLLFKAGALDQNVFEAPLLAYLVTYPAAFQQWTIGSRPFSVQLTAEQAIPTTSTFSNLPSELEPMSYYDIERAKMEAEMGNFGKLEARVSHWGFHNLPRAVAQDSRFLGNTVDGLGAPDASFTYQFDGIETGGKYTFNPTGRFRPALGGSYLINLQAPDGQNRGMEAFLETEIVANSNLSLTPSFSVFRMEADSSPADYNADYTGHNNRVGYGAGMKAEMKKSALSITGSFFQATPISYNQYQSNFTGVFLYLRKAYDLL